MALDATIETIETAGRGITAVVTLSGMMTLGTNLKTADQQVQSALDQGAKNLVLDLTGVSYSDSAGLGMLVHTYGLIKRSGGQFRLCGVQERVMSMLRMTTTDKFLPVDEDRASSLAALGIDSVTGSA
jgi:anti-anti-sigma factor